MKYSLVLTVLCLLGTAPAADFNFLVYSDIQSYGTGYHAQLPAIMGRIPGGCAFAVCTGDLINLGNYDTVLSPAVWNTFLSVTSAMPAPFWPVRGNHDGWEDVQGRTLTSWGTAMSFVRDRPEYLSGSDKNDYYSFMVNNCLFLVLNNMGSSVKVAETTWIAAQARSVQARNADHIFAFFHYEGLLPNQPEATRRSNKWTRYITPSLESLPNLAAVFWGDDHCFWSGSYKGVAGVLVPPGTLSRSAYATGSGEKSDSMRGYIVVRVKDDSVTAKVFDYGENLRHSLVLQGGSSGLAGELAPTFTVSGLRATPNPFSSSVNLTWLPLESGVRPVIQIFSLDGRKLHSSEVSFADHGFDWDASGRAPGIYLARLQAGNAILVKALQLVK